ncbi:retrovirus-related pol polyprotein from transposon TNT 1-94, partial [Tanacetum coccineum]
MYIFYNNDDRKNYLDYLCIDLNYVEEQRNNLMSKHRDIVQELNTCKEKLLILKQAKLDFLIMQHVNTKILKENQNLRKELKELTTITKTWLNRSNKVNQCISDQIPTQKKRILGIHELTEDLFSSRILLVDSQRTTIEPPVTVTDSSVTNYDSVDESLVCSTPLPQLKKLDGAKPVSGPKTIKSILKSKSIFKAEGLKGVIINEPFLAPAKGPKVVFGDDSTCTTKDYGSIKCNGIVLTKVAFVNCLKYNLVSISQLCDAKYIVQFDEKRGTIFNSNKEVVMIALRVRDVYVLDMTSSTQETCFFAKASKNLNWLWHKRLAHLNFKKINRLAKEILLLVFPHLSTQRTNHVRHVKRECIIGPTSKQHRHLGTARNSILVNFCDEKVISYKNSSPYTHEQNGVAEKNKTLIEATRTMLSGSRIPNIDFIHVFGCPMFIHNHKDHLGKFDEKADDGYLLGYSLVSKAFGVLNTRRQQTEETYHITFDEIPNAIKSQNLYNEVSFIEPYESPEPIVLETKVSSDQNGQEDTLVQDTIPIPNPSLSKPSMTSLAPQDRWSQDKHIELVNIIGDLGDGMLIRAMARELSAASAHECLFVDFLSEEEPKKVFRNKRDETRIVVKTRQDLIFLAFATYMNFIVYQMDVKSAFLNGKLKEEVYVKQPPDFESSEFPNHVCKLDKALYRLNKLQEHVKTPMVSPNNLGPDLNGKAINETRYQANPKESHLIVVMRIFRFLKGTPSLGLWYLKCSGFDLKGYSDSDYVGCNMDRKSTSVAMYSAEAEYVAAAGCCANILWMKSQLTDYDIIYEKVPIFCDNTSAIAISNNPVLHSRTKHIDIIYHFIRNHILKGDIELHFIPTQYQLANIFTKPLDEPTFKRLIVELSMLNIDSKTEPFFHYHSESASGCDALANSTTEADPGIFAPNDFIPEQHDQTKSAGDGLKTAHTDLGTNEESRSDEISKKIKLEDLSNLMQDTRTSFLTPNSPRDEPTIVSDESEEEETERYEDTHTTSHDGPEDTSIQHPPSPKSVQIQELMAQVQLLQSQKNELEQQKAKAE